MRRKLQYCFSTTSNQYCVFLRSFQRIRKKSFLVFTVVWAIFRTYQKLFKTWKNLQYCLSTTSNQYCVFLCSFQRIRNKASQFSQWCGPPPELTKSCSKCGESSGYSSTTKNTNAFHEQHQMKIKLRHSGVIHVVIQYQRFQVSSKMI